MIKWWWEGGNAYYNLTTLVKDLLHLQKSHINKTNDINDILFGPLKKMEIEIESLEKDQTSDLNQ